MSKTIILSFPDFPEDTDILIENDAPFYIKGQFSAEINSEFFAAKLAKMYDMVFFPMDRIPEWSLDFPPGKRPGETDS